VIRRTNRKWQGKTYHTYYMDVDPGGEMVKLPGVTTILKMWPKGDVLVNWAARTVAEFVADNWEQVQALYPMGRAAVVDNLKFQHRNRMEAAAATGTEVHQLAADLVAGAQVDVPDHLVARVTGYAKWLDEWQVDPIGVEQTVASRKVGYAGTFDLAARIEAGPWQGRNPLLDVKTGRGAYGEAGLQLAAYASADCRMGPAGDELPPYPIDCTGVVHVTDEGVAVYPTAKDPAAITRQFEVFRHLAWLHRQVPYVDGVRGGAPGLIDLDHPLYASGDPGAGWEG
jgi:hypothetical protein